MRPLRIVSAVVLTAGLLAIPGQASAAPDRTFTRYDQKVTLASDGTATVSANIDLDFSRESGRGPIFTFITKMTLPDDDTKYRAIEYQNFNITSPSGANTTITRTEDTNTLTLRIGSEHRTYNDIQSYTLTYTVRGLIEPNHATSGLDEFNWNAIGLSGDMAIENPTVTITGPAEMTKAACWSGSNYTTPCEATQDGATAVFSADHLDRYEGMQVVAGFPAGTFTGAEATIDTYRSGLGSGWLNPASIGAGALLLAGAAGLVATKRRNGTDDSFAGVTPGTIPDDSAEPAIIRRRLGRAAVQFTPPAGVLPGTGAVLLAARRIPKEATSATLIDLARRGYLQISEDGNKNWKLQLLTTSHQELSQFEAGVLESIFADRLITTTRAIAKSDTVSHNLGVDQVRLCREVVSAGWFRSDPEHLGRGLQLAGLIFLIFVLPVGLLVTLANDVPATVVLPLAAVAVVLSVAAVLVPLTFSNRTAVGSALDAQLRGFKEYIKTAAADQLKWEEGQDIFSEYLPWAIVFGAAERWTKLFAQLAAQGRYTPTVAWYSSTHGAGFTPDFTSSVSTLTSSMNRMASSATTYATSGSSSAVGGSSGFSSRGGGGGFGGGGSSSW